jgi:prepilin-type processing-associated H-X9-DG protein
MRSVVLVLVVVVVLVLGGGLLVIGVSRVREAAGRILCTNNLKQIGLTIQNYAATYDGQLPQATEPNPRLAPEKRLSWLVSILPFVEANNLYSRTDRTKGWDAEENRFLALTDYKVYQCPAFPEGPPLSTLMPSHYVGIAGLGSDAAVLPLEDARAGLLGYERKLNYKDLEKGTSTLLVMVETAQVAGAWSAGGWPTVRGLDPDDPPYLGPGGQFGGLHREGVNVLFADGTVRGLRRSIDSEVLEALVTIKGSQEVDPGSIE